MLTNMADRTTLNNGLEMPWLGFGVFQVEPGEQTEQSVAWALEAGYRSLDTANVYGNESDVGRAIKSSGIPREQIFLTTKLWNSDQGYASTLAAFDKSLSELDTPYADLYLVHWPKPDMIHETWRAMQEIYRSGRARAIGVSNFLQHHLETLLEKAAVVPAVNQIEFHPRLVQPSLLAYCRKQGIQPEAWSPLMRGKYNELPGLDRLVEKYGKTGAQIILRWDLQHKVVTIPRSVKRERIISNTELFDFELSDSEVAYLDSLDSGQRVGPHPDHITF